MPKEPSGLADVSETLRIQPARLGDEACVRDFGRKIWGGEVGSLQTQHYAYELFEKYWDEDYLRYIFSRDDNVFLVAQNGQEVIGALHAYCPTPNAAILSRIYVGVEYCRQGIGRQLIQRGEAALPGAVEYLVTGAPPGTEAVDFFSGVGFQTLGTVQSEVSFGTVSMTQMARRVDRNRNELKGGTRTPHILPSVLRA